MSDADVQTIKQSDPRLVERDVYFTAMDSTAVFTPLQLTTEIGAFVVKLTKNGAAPITAGGTVTEVDVTNMKGVFRLRLTVGDCDTVGKIVVVITNTGGTKTMIRREIILKIKAATFVTAVTGTLGVNAFTSNRAEANNVWTDVLLRSIERADGTASANYRQCKRVGAFANSGGLFTLHSTTPAWASIPVDQDLFEVVND